jgi:hypothetical protein
LCAVQSLGPFNAAKVGHLVLWDLKIVVEFPAGALIRSARSASPSCSSPLVG